MACPEGELQQTIFKKAYVSLHEMDVLNSKNDFTDSFINHELNTSLNFNSSVDAGNTDNNFVINHEVRAKVNRHVKELLLKGKIHLRSGILFIDELYMLDCECYSTLNRLIESDLCPFLVLTSNHTPPNDHSMQIDEHLNNHLDYPLGIAPDFLERSIIIRTNPYTLKELQSIIEIRAREENIKLSDEACIILCDVASSKSLRYALQIMSVSNILLSRHRIYSDNSIFQIQKTQVARALHLFSYS